MPFDTEVRCTHFAADIKKFSRNLASHTTIDGHSNDGEIAQVFLPIISVLFTMILLAIFLLIRNMLMNFRRYRITKALSMNTA